MQLKCPCGEGIDAREDLTDSNFQEWLTMLSTRAEMAERREGTSCLLLSTDGVVNTLLDGASRTACPWCDTRYLGYDGCAALTCDTCGRYFCGLCHSRCSTWKDAHTHVTECRLNRTLPRSYYVPTSMANEVNKAQTQSRIASALQTFRRKDGLLIWGGVLQRMHALRVFTVRELCILVIGKRGAACVEHGVQIVIGSVVGGACAWAILEWSSG